MNDFNNNFDICANCCTQIPKGAAFCPCCGQKNAFANHQNTNAYSVPNNQNPYYINTPANNYVDRKTFVENFAHPSLRKKLSNLTTTSYIFCGFNIFSLIVLIILYYVSDPVFYSNIFSLLQYTLSSLVSSLVLGIVFLGLTLGMHHSKSRGCAIAYFVITVVLSLINIISGNVPPLVFLSIGISALTIFNSTEKQYKDFIRSQNNTFNQ